MLSAIGILPGVRGRIRPVRIVARDVPYYSNHSQWWGPDGYFKGGQLTSGQEPALDTDDPEFYETERWGHFPCNSGVSGQIHGNPLLHRAPRCSGEANIQRLLQRKDDPVEPEYRGGSRRESPARAKDQRPGA